MTERALIRSPAQARALLAGATQVRVPVVPQPRRHLHDGARDIGMIRMESGAWFWECACGYDQPTRCPLGVAGDRLVVKEDWKLYGIRTTGGKLFALVAYRDGSTRAIEHPDPPSYPCGSGEWERWRSPVTMPRWAARLILEVVEVRAQKLGGVTEDDAIAEGYAPEKSWTSEPPSPLDVMEACWGAEHNRRRWLAWSPDLWTFVATVRRAEGAPC